MEKLEKSLELFNIGLDEFITIIKNGLSLDHIYMLQMYEQECDISVFSIKLKGYRLTLIRKGYLNEDNTLTGEGKSILKTGDIHETLKANKAKIKAKTEKIKTDFDRWWEVFPSTDRIKEANMDVTRNLQEAKSKCRELFREIVDKGEHTAEEIIKATAWDVQNRINISIKTRKNSLTFLQNSATYLRQRTFAAFIGLEINKKEEQSSGGVVDI